MVAPLDEARRRRAGRVARVRQGPSTFRMTSGRELLERARAMAAAEVEATFGWQATGRSDAVDRPALVAALLTECTAADVELVRALTAFQIADRAAADDGCGEVLLACCVLLYRIGRAEDAPLVWQAKEVNFDAALYLDGALLVPAGVAATRAVARDRGLDRLVEYLDAYPPEPLLYGGWRSNAYFASRPGLDAPVEELAAWLVD